MTIGRKRKALAMQGPMSDRDDDQRRRIEALDTPEWEACAADGHGPTQPTLTDDATACDCGTVTWREMEDG